MRELGVWLTIDDFGTGFSSLSRLQRLPVHGLKIDQSFVAGLEHEDADRAIVDATLGLASALGVRVIAEGVETVGQAEYLLGGGCEMGQGHLYGAAMHAGEISELLSAGGRLGPPATTPRRRAAAPRAPRTARARPR